MYNANKWILKNEKFIKQSTGCEHILCKRPIYKDGNLKYSWKVKGVVNKIESAEKCHMER